MGRSVPTGTDWQAELRARGYRLTAQRQLVLEAVGDLGHATPEEISTAVRRTASGVNISTVYRTLELLEELGLVQHTHLGHGAPTYSVTGDDDHVHLVCRDCDAVEEASPDLIAVAGHYGDPYREQRLPGPVDLSHRPVVRVTGPDRLSWLHSLTSQHLLALEPGASTEALVLSPNGHVEHHLQLADDGEQLLAHVEPGTAGDLLAFLDRMRFLLRVEVSDASADWAVVWDAEPGRPGLAQRTGFGQYTFVPRGELPECTSGLLAHEALRVAARRPRLGFDTDAKTLPHEVGWLVGAVHLDKGCYRGQESVARVHNLGRPRGRTGRYVGAPPRARTRRAGPG